MLLANTSSLGIRAYPKGIQLAPTHFTVQLHPSPSIGQAAPVTDIVSRLASVLGLNRNRSSCIDSVHFTKEEIVSAQRKWAVTSTDYNGAQRAAQRDLCGAESVIFIAPPKYIQALRTLQRASETLEDKEVRGRTSSLDDEVLRALMEENPRITVLELARKLTEIGHR
ncbi:unnamed protein product [Nezara viridula]|uniref:Uncharacterized protein n=1 Tax=Nezara viridula TaxID=85310 RepID=A0A9P0E9D8_NEZVI|nr:unnamed protein product [Nezara viridula]